MNIREFSFKFFNNTLSLNYRLAHFVQGRAQDCTFCRIAKVHPVPAETFDHFFFDCEFNARIRSIFENTLLPELGLAQITEKKNFGSWDNSNIFFALVAKVFLYSMWQFKLQKRLPMIHSFEMEFLGNLTKIVNASRMVKVCMTLNNVTICRNWDELQHRRG